MGSQSGSTVFVPTAGSRACLLGGRSLLRGACALRLDSSARPSPLPALAPARSAERPSSRPSRISHDWPGPHVLAPASCCSALQVLVARPSKLRLSRPACALLSRARAGRRFSVRPLALGLVCSAAGPCCAGLVPRIESSQRVCCRRPLPLHPREPRAHPFFRPARRTTGLAPTRSRRPAAVRRFRPLSVGSPSPASAARLALSLQAPERVDVSWPHRRRPLALGLVFAAARSCCAALMSSASTPQRQRLLLLVGRWPAAPSRGPAFRPALLRRPSELARGVHRHSLTSPASRGSRECALGRTSFSLLVCPGARPAGRARGPPPRHGRSRGGSTRTEVAWPSSATECFGCSGGHRSGCGIWGPRPPATTPATHM
jgi:hypothetical protein